MTTELPQHLQETAELLTRSLHQHPQDTAPPIPRDLVRDLSSARSSAVPFSTARPAKASYFERLRLLLAAPGFGLAAAAIVLLGVLGPSLLNTGPEKTQLESFRGSKTIHTASEATLVIITTEPETRRLLEESGLIEMSRVIETSDPLVAASIRTAKLLVDVRGGAIVGFDSESREVLADQLPEDQSELAERIVLAFGALQ